jgi:hypothetical protein
MSDATSQPVPAPAGDPAPNPVRVAPAEPDTGLASLYPTMKPTPAPAAPTLDPALAKLYPSMVKPAAEPTAAATPPSTARPDASAAEAPAAPQAAAPAQDAAPAAIPEAYRDLAAPEGFQIDAKAFAPVAAELGKLGVTREQAEGLLAVHAKLEAEADAAVAAENARWRQTAEAALRPGDRETIAAVMRDAPAEVKNLLQRTGLGNHPALVKWVADLGRRMNAKPTGSFAGIYPSMRRQ